MKDRGLSPREPLDRSLSRGPHQLAYDSGHLRSHRKRATIEAISCAVRFVRLESIRLSKERAGCAASLYIAICLRRDRGKWYAGLHVAQFVRFNWNLRRGVPLVRADQRVDMDERQRKGTDELP